jgi:hypothetical protein
LEFHLPYPILRATPSADEVSELDSCVQEHDLWQDISFLDIPPNEKGYSNYSVRKAHISLVVTGSDHFRWTGYAFANTGVSDLIFDEGEESNVAEDGQKEQEEGGAGGGGEEDEEEDEPELDYFPSDGQGELVLAEDIIQDPRRYWLRAVGLRLITILKEYDYLVHKVEDSVHVWVSINVLYCVRIH